MRSTRRARAHCVDRACHARVAGEYRGPLNFQASRPGGAGERARRLEDQLLAGAVVVLVRRGVPRQRKPSVPGLSRPILAGTRLHQLPDWRAPRAATADARAYVQAPFRSAATCSSHRASKA